MISSSPWLAGRAGFGAPDPDSRGTKMLANQLRFVLFQRTGVRLLLGNAHRRQRVKNFLALDFQLTGQIIDSNLHPLSFSFSSRSLELYVRISNLTESLLTPHRFSDR